MALLRRLVPYACWFLPMSNIVSAKISTNLHISNAQIAPDGYTRSAVLANGTFPGPPVVGYKGTNFQVNVINQLTDSSMVTSTTVHWHGIYQEGTNWADGTAFINQCPIASGNSFSYNFSVPDQTGTFWYHSHISTQYCDGLRGAMVVYDPNDPYLDYYDVDDESTIITLADWYHTVSPQLQFPTADTTLINGKGRWWEDPISEVAVITVQRGTRYRFRLVSLSCDPNFVFSIDEHQMTIIEVDGVNHERLSVDSIQIYAGQRYSFILNANQPVGNYWVRALPNLGPPSNFSAGINSAILRYVGAPAQGPSYTTIPVSETPLVETNLQPLANPQAPGDPYPGGTDISLSLAVDFNGTNFLINGEPWTSPSVPVLLQILSGANTVQSLMPAGSYYSLPSGKTVEINFPVLMDTGEPHPVHLHGHTFSVVRAAGQTTPNYDNPVQRDVVNVGSGGDNVTIRFTTDNPGPWFLHCHIDWHLEAGFAVVMAEDIADVSSDETPSASWKSLC